MKRYTLMTCILGLVFLLASCDSSSSKRLVHGGGDSDSDGGGGSSSDLQYLLHAIKYTVDKPNLWWQIDIKNSLKAGVAGIVPLSGAATSVTFDTSKLTDHQVQMASVNGSLSNWRCYKSEGSDALKLTRSSAGIEISGTIVQYGATNDSKCQQTPIHTYVFKHGPGIATPLIDDKMQLTQGSFTVDGQTADGSSYILADLYVGAVIDDVFGNAWAKMIRSEFIAQAKAHPEMLKMENGEIKYDDLTNITGLIDYTTLNKSKILDGTVFVTAQATHASGKWCKIINIPKDISDDTLKVQAVIATNCARSKQRWCDINHKALTGADYPAVKPIAWSDESQRNAMLNSKKERTVNKMTHSHISYLQNTHFIHVKSAINPIFGYASPRNDGKDNNSGRLSFTGHEGHCQNVMDKGASKMGLSWLPVPDKNKRGYWTQNLDQ